MKYFVARKSKATGRIEYKRTKCTDEWCSPSYTGHIWQFTKRGAAGIVEREKRFRGWGWEYYIVPCFDK